MASSFIMVSIFLRFLAPCQILDLLRLWWHWEFIHMTVFPGGLIEIGASRLPEIAWSQTIWLEFVAGEAVAVFVCRTQQSSFQVRHATIQKLQANRANFMIIKSPDSVYDAFPVCLPLRQDGMFAMWSVFHAEELSSLRHPPLPPGRAESVRGIFIRWEREKERREF